MKKIQNPYSCSGFTLFELAIVLTIIGLVAGGILAGQAFIRTSQLTTMMNEAKFYRNAFNSFENKYGGIPGDLPNAQDFWNTAATCPPTGGVAIPSGTCNGNGDGLIYLGSLNYPELYYVFQHLAKAGLIQGSYSGVTGTGGAVDMLIGANIPASPLDNVGYYFTEVDATTMVSGNTLYYDGVYQHPLQIGKSIPGQFALGYFLTGPEMLRLDTKYDDGKPGLGMMRAAKSSAMPDCTTTTNATTAVYVSSATIGCNVILTAP